jgi:hypothetical protein
MDRFTETLMITDFIFPFRFPETQAGRGCSESEKTNKGFTMKRLTEKTLRKQNLANQRGSFSAPMI